ncbi:unnamed protein product [Oncorhynchus mykiss]|uniref:Adenomatous polyposis coli protein basic domain-containing protein n=1 Tax=Oncorhynchus mykiss TaxID=8022 RepID=A0A060WQH9_ONCMY|nr:unnamed protein product [Oncorhynchus mykiss]
MANSTASYDQLVYQVEALRQENSHLRRELEDNSNHLSKLENETTDMKGVLKGLQSKLELEAGTLASSGRTDVLDQLKELHMDLTNYYELKYQPQNMRVLPDSLASLAAQSGDMDDCLACLPPSSSRARSPLRPSSRQSSSLSGEGTAVNPGALTKAMLGDRRITAQHLEDLYKERTMLLSEIDKEERERHWYYSQLQGLSQRLNQLPRIDTFSIQIDLIRQQLEFEAQQLRSVMEERFGTSDEMVQRTQIRVARLEQLEKELQEAQESRGTQEKSLCEISSCEKQPIPETEHALTASALDAQGDGSKVEMVFWLLSMLANRDKEEMSRTLLALSSSQDSCIAMRKSGCVPLLVQILHDGPGGAGESARSVACSREAQSRASTALHNIVYSQPDEGQARREMRVLHVLEQIRSHCDSGWDWIESHVRTPSPGGTTTTDIPEPVEPQICQAMCAVMKLSFEEEYRRAMNELGGLQVVAEVMHLDQELYGMQNDPINMALRRYAGMALTNLTFGDVVNKATLCTKKSCLQAIVTQLASDSEELHQVVSSILRNLSWRADINSKRVLRDVGSVTGLITCALQATKESTLKSLLSALWNLSAHSPENKVAICSVDGALGFLVSTLTYRCQTNSLAIIESGGGILRNVSSLVATRDDYRQILRDHNCLQTLLQHLRSHSLTIVSNACGTLWNLSARSPKDQELLWDLGAVSMLRNLIHSKHKMIAMGSAAALRNLLTNRPFKYKDAAVISPGSCMPSLYMRKQKALEAELDAKHLAETFDSIGKKNCAKHPSINKPLWHIESLAKDYASDSGCFDDDEAPNVSSSLDTGSFSMLSMFLTNSNFLQNQLCKKDSEPERDVEPPQTEEKKPVPPEDEVSVAAEKLAKKITNTVAKIDKLVEDITMHTSSEDSFSLSSEDRFADLPYGSDELHEARAKSCSPCRLSDTSSYAHRERLNRAHAILRLKTTHASLSTDSLNSGSTSDGYCGSKDQIRPSARRPNKLDLKKSQALPPQTPASLSTKFSSDVSMTSIKLSPSYQHIPLIQSVAKFGVAKTAINVHAAQAMRRQAWVPTVMTGGSLTKFSPMSSARSPTIGPMETLQKYSVENTPICFSRCSSLSSLSSGDEALDGQSQSELESDSSLEIIEDLSDSQLLVTDSKTCQSLGTDPIEIPCPTKHEKDRSPSSSSENYIHETPLVMSRCSSVSSLGSFESHSIASSILSDPCSEMISGTISPSDLPDSPGQTMPPSRSKTPCFAESNGTESQNAGTAGQWESSLRKFMDIADFKERFNLPPDLDTMIYFTVEKPTENFSCASSLSALPLHEHFIQKDVELKLTPILQQKDNNSTSPQAQGEPDDNEHPSFMDQGERYSEGNSDDDIEILKECINSAMPSKFRKVRPSLISTLPTHVLNSQTRKPIPVYMMVPNNANQMCSGRRIVMQQKDLYLDDSSYTDSAEGTPVNFSSTTSLSDETLQYPPDIPVNQINRSIKHPNTEGNQNQRALQGNKAFQSIRCPTEEAIYCLYNEQTDKEEGVIKRAGKKQMRESSKNTLSRSMTNIGRIDNSQTRSKCFNRIKHKLIMDETPPCYSLSGSLSSLIDAEFEEHQSKAQQIWYEEQSSPSSVSMDSEDDLLQKCITSAMPKQRKKLSARKKAEKKQKQRNVMQNVASGWNKEQEFDSEDMASDKDSDLNSVEWREIQEGANSVVTRLQASKSQEPSSEETESVLSFMSGSSFTPKENKIFKDKKANKPLDFNQRKPVPNLPVVFRGRTVTYTPKKEINLSQIPPPNKMSPKTDAPKNPNLAQQRSRSLHRLGQPRDSTQCSSSGSSQSSTPSRQSPKKITFPSQTSQSVSKKDTTPASSPPERNGRSTVPSNPTPKSPAHKTQKSPVRIPFMQNAARQSRTLSPLVTNQPTSISRQNSQVAGKRIPPANRVTSVHSSCSESDRNGFLRQLTFIKESKTMMRRDGPSSRSVPTSQHASPRKTIPGAPAVFLCSSRCQELKASRQGLQRQTVTLSRACSSDRDLSTRHPARRTSSESPCRLPQRNISATKQQERDTIKHHSSSPSINILSRVTSRSSLRSSSSDSSGRAKSEDDTNKKQQRTGSRLNDRVTWRRIRDEDVPQILKSTLPSTALPLLPVPEGPKPKPPALPGKLPTILLNSRKTSDATVQTEDFSSNKTNSSTSPTVETAPVISEEAARLDLLRKISIGSGQDGGSDGCLKSYSTASTGNSHSVETHTGGVGHFRQSSPSMAVRVTPFNYIPSPMACCLQDTQSQETTINEKSCDKSEAQ